MLDFIFFWWSKWNLCKESLHFFLLKVVTTFFSQNRYYCTVPLKSKLPVLSHFSRDENLISRDESLISRDENLISRDKSLVSRDESLISRDESLVSRDSLKWQFWNKLQANSLARSRLQYCAKVMRTNFALFSSKYRRTFNWYFAAFVRLLNEISAYVNNLLNNK